MLRILEKIHVGTVYGFESDSKVGSGSVYESEKIIPDPQQ
jgi:hypothetical protein